jgi:two-component system cell cycle response regulator
MKILVAEDDSVMRHLLKVSLERWQYEVLLATNGTQAMEIMLGKDAPQLAILDWVMPGIDGVDICRELRNRDAGSYIYTLLLTSKGAKEDLLVGLEAGVDDYLVKPFDLLELQARLRSGQRIITLQDQLIAAREAMREQATRDALTGVWNRGAIMDILQREFSRSRREHKPLVALMLDLDHFKQINDTLGHQAGDFVLREVAIRVLSAMRPYNSMGRCGGEEFVVIVPGCDEASALNLAERLRNCVSATPIATSTDSIPVTMSLGVASLAEDSSPESLIGRADEALYRAKKAGRNRCEVG